MSFRSLVCSSSDFFSSAAFSSAFFSSSRPSFSLARLAAALARSFSLLIKRMTTKREKAIMRKLTTFWIKLP